MVAYCRCKLSILSGVMNFCRVRVTGALRKAPGTAASIAATASDSGIFGKMLFTRSPAVPPRKIMGKTLPPRKPLDWLRATANILAIRMATIKPVPNVADISSSVAS